MERVNDGVTTCRVDLFIGAGRFDQSIVIAFPLHVWRRDPSEALCIALNEAIIDDCDRSAVCLYPYVQNPMPVMVRNWKSFGQTKPEVDVPVSDIRYMGPFVKK